MGISDRLQKERKRLGLTQEAAAEKLGATKRSVINWEGGASLPGAEVLAGYAAAGADVLYVLTGEPSLPKGEPDIALSAEEELMLDCFRDAPKERRRQALKALLGGAPETHIGGTHSQHNSGDGAVQIGSIGSAPVKRRR